MFNKLLQKFGTGEDIVEEMGDTYHVTSHPS